MALPEGLISRSEAAALVGVHVNTIRNWERAGYLSAERVRQGGRTYIGFRAKNVEALARERGHTAVVGTRNPEAADRLVEAEAELRLVRERLAELKQERDDLLRRLLDQTR